MSTFTNIRVDGRLFRLVGTVDEGSSLYFSGGRSIAVEKFDMRPGGTEFDFQVNSRAFRGGRPQAVASTQAGMDNEFMEARVKSNLVGLPLSYGNINEMRRQRRIELSYGELRPQVFTSRVAGAPLAWRIWFKRTHYAGNPSVPRLPKGTAVPRATGSAAVRGMSETPNRDHAPGAIGPLTNAAGILRVYVEGNDAFQVFGRPFDGGDVIFRPTTLMEHLGSFVRGRGW